MPDLLASLLSKHVSPNRAALQPFNTTAPSLYDTNAEREKLYLAQRRARGLSDLVFGVGDFANTVVNAGIRDVDYFTGGGLSKGTYDPYQFSMPSQDAADLATTMAKATVVPHESMPPHIQKQGANAQVLMGTLPVGPEALAPALKTAVLHSVPNLFKAAAVEDAALGRTADKIWHDWGWEQNALGDWWTETIGNPKMNENVVRVADKTLPPRGSDFAPFEPNHDFAQRPLFPPSELPHKGAWNQQMPTTRDPLDPTFNKPKYGYLPGTVKDFVTNPTLYEQPGLEFLGELPMTLKDVPLTDNASGFFSWPNDKQPQGSITVRSNQPAMTPSYETVPGNPDPLQTAQHELTHAAAQEFGLPQGFNPRDALAEKQGAYMRSVVQSDKDAYEAAFNKRTADYWRLQDELYDLHGDDPDMGPSLYTFNKQWANDNPELGELLEAGDPSLYDLLGKSNPNLAYHTSMGEVSAQNSSRRDTGKLAYPPEVLRTLRPELTEGVPRKYQWTRDKHGNIINPKAK